MIYNEILGLSEHFQPAYDIENEIGTYWKQFIPNDKFYKVLYSVLNSLEGNKPEDSKSIYLQATYGTGKSHATAVIKHLLYDDLENIDDFEIRDAQLKFKLENFRSNNRVFPVILKGTGRVYDNRTFALVIERAVKESLREEGVEISIKTNFEEMISQLRNNNINWDNIFNGTELAVHGLEKIISRLEDYDPDILTKIEDVLSENNIFFPPLEIDVWLKEVRNELKDKGIADYLMLYWDEFTGVFELEKSGLILSEVQNIAELSINNGIYLFLIAHRRPYQTNIARDDLEKILGRFKELEYAMEPITTYHIINNTIKKINKSKWEEYKNRYLNYTKFLIEEIVGNEGKSVQTSLEDLFPIHPYTAYLATFMARNIGSTQRSIFMFLYNEEYGFKGFINENPANGEIFLTANYLWDFFYDDFEDIEDDKIYYTLERFKQYNDILKNEGIEYLSVFKGILLLNILYKVAQVTEASLVAPSEVNIRNIFSGSMEEENLNDILELIDERKILSKNPDNLFLLTSSGLPPREVETEKNKLKNSIKKIDQILDPNQKKEIINLISGSVNREVEFIIMDTSLNENLILNKLSDAFKKDYKIHLCVFLGRNEQEQDSLKNTLYNLSKNKEYENIIFVISDIVLREEEFDKYLEYQALANVADKHRLKEDKNNNERLSRKVIDKWINNIKSGYLEWYMQGDYGKDLIRHYSSKINNNLSKRVFSSGLENISSTRKNRAIWKRQKSRTSIEKFLFPINREGIELETIHAPYVDLRAILKDNNNDYVVTSDLELTDSIPDNHPLKVMKKKINALLKESKSKGKFNLGDALSVLAESPYGLYSNMVNMSTLAFLMREYTGKLFEVGTGNTVQNEMMRDKILLLFDFWENGKNKGKLEFRFGSEDEETLTKILNDLFKLDNIMSLTNARWKVREWAKNEGFPIWVFKSADPTPNEKTGKAIDSICELVQSNDEELNLEKIIEHLNAIEPVTYELNILIRQNPCDLFKNWLMSIDKIDITLDDFESINAYIRKNMPEEIALWDEAKTREIVKDWVIEHPSLVEPPEIPPENPPETTNDPPKTSPENPPETTNDPPKTSPENPPETTNDPPKIPPKNPPETPPKDPLKKIVTEIELCEDKKLKIAVINTIKERPDIVIVIKKYLEA